MIDALGEAVAGSIVEWVVARLGPALVFATGGALAWLFAHGGWDRLVALGAEVAELPTLVLLAVVTAILAGTFAATVLARLLTRPVLRLLEGYWPHWLRRALVTRQAERRAKLAQQLRSLVALTDDGNVTAVERAALARCEARLHRLPSEQWLMPTRLGNMLRAAETRPYEKYGLDSVAVWPHLWLTLPDPARSDLAAARDSLNRAVACVIWALAFLAFTGWSIWALVLGLGLATWAVLLWIPHRAARYADLLEAAFDVHRVRLYQQLRWPLPTNPDAERREGELLTTYLVRGRVGTSPTFTEVSEP